MKRTSYLYKAFNKALGSFSEPVSDSQWDRIDAELRKEKRERKGLPIIWVVVLMLFTGTIAWWLGNNMKHSNNAGTSFNNQADKNSGKTTIPELKAPTNQLHSYSQTENITNNNPQFGKPVTLNKTYNFEANDLLDISGNISKNNAEESFEKDNIKSTGNAGENKVFQPLQEPENTNKGNDDFAVNMSKITDTTTKNAPTTKQITPAKPPIKNKIAISLSFGLAGIKNSAISLGNNDKMHKDTRSIFEQNNEHLQARFVQLGLDIPLFKSIGLGFKSGIQIKQISNTVNMNYEYNEIPFKNQEGGIIGYVHKDTGILFNYHSVHTVSYITLPLNIRYTIPLNAKNDILISAGTNITYIMGAKGKDLFLNEAEVKQLSQKAYKPLSMGLNFGIQYSHEFRPGWWVGFETIWQQNKQIMNQGPGTISSNLRGINGEIILKYKLK